MSSVESWWSRRSLKFLGFKQKNKLPSLTIQQPPQQDRTQSNSISTIRSSLEPTTPSDPLPFQLSLKDPFASQGISINSSHSPTDIWWRNTIASSGSQEKNTSEPSTTPQARLRTISKSGSSTTLTPPTDDQPIDRSPLPPKSPKPTLLLRRASSSRLSTQPPTAPPTHNLPLPPESNSSDEDLCSYIIPSDIASSASSVLSFAASHSTDEEAQLAHSKFLSRHKSDWGRDSPLLPKSSASASFLHRPVEITRTLKKATSHQSFSPKRASFTSDDDRTPPQKQRSFHHPRFSPPHRHANSSKTPTFTTAASFIETGEKRKANTVSPTTTSAKKRLFSGSSIRRPSTAQGEHDTRSLFSLPPLDTELKQDISFSKSPSLYTCEIDETDTVSIAPTTKSEYVPMQIMSPAEMLRVEASVRDSTDFPRHRGPSSPSSMSTSLSALSTTDLFNDFLFPGALTPPSSTHTKLDLSPSYSNDDNDNESQILPIRSASLGSRALSSPRLRHRPTTSPQTYTAPSSPPSSRSLLTPSPERLLISLPPPPRPRPRPPTADFTSITRSSSVVPLSPPPPPRPRMRTSPSLESTIFRRALIKKPSFLDIDDEFDIKPPDDSFLDLQRDSFDTVRSLTDPSAC